MKKEFILHIMPGDSVLIAPPFVEFIEHHFNFSEHLFILDTRTHTYDSRPNVSYGYIGPKNMVLFLKTIWNMFLAKKIIMHGLFSAYTLLILFCFPFLLKKTYWVIWGGDLYCYRKKNDSWKRVFIEIMRRHVIKKIEVLVTYIKGDYELAKKWYGTQGEYLHCIMYPSNLFKESLIPLQKTDTKTHILVGNSADPSNEHLEIFNKVLQFKEHDIVLYAPLVYGNKTYADTVIKKGQELFGEKFIPIIEALSSERYTEFLSKMDIAIFAHRRQQAMGNTITLLGLGKKVYLRQDVSSWEVFESLNVKTFDFNGPLDISLLSESEVKKNKTLIKKHFSKESLYKQFQEIFQRP